MQVVALTTEPPRLSLMDCSFTEGTQVCTKPVRAGRATSLIRASRHEYSSIYSTYVAVP